jgi:hypothetical protein
VLTVLVMAGSFSAGTTDALYGQGRITGLFGDQPILFFDRGTGGSITIEATKDFAWHSPIGPPRTVLIEHIEQSELFSRRGFSCHWRPPVVGQLGDTPADGHRGIAKTCKSPA